MPFLDFEILSYILISHQMWEVGFRGAVFEGMPSLTTRGQFHTSPLHSVEMTKYQHQNFKFLHTITNI